VSEPLILALDTSTRTASLALFDGTTVLSETTWLAGREHSTRLLVETQIAFERIGRTPNELTGMAVARGPGSFTGVRVALSVVKGIAGGLGIPGWGVSSLDVLALAAEPSKLPVRAVIEAGRGRYATALYVDGHASEEAHLATSDDLLNPVSELTVVVGELAPELRGQLTALPNVRLAPVAASVRRAGFLAELAWRQALSGDPGDPRLLDAIYIT
jgi:tRNA threonylcarbamoyladenosine biosynthesis protein TsaB